MKDDHRSYIHNFYIGKRKPEKNSGLYGIRTLDLCDTGIAEVKGTNPVQAGIFFQAFFPQLQRLRICVHIIWFSYIQNFIKKKLSCTLLLVLIFNNYWTRLSKIVICLWRADQLFAEAEARLRQIIDLRDTDKSLYFAITQFNNCFIIRSPSLFF